MAVYRGEQLSQISFPLGGIGAGCIGLAGNGHLIDWEIFNRPNKGGYNGMTHFAARAFAGDRLLDARVLQGIPQPPYSGADLAGNRTNFGFGLHRQSMGGAPCFEHCEFTGTFPIAEVTLSDARFPGVAHIEAFSPFIPGDEDSTSIPAAFFTVTVENPLDVAVDYDIALSVCNPAKHRCINRIERDAESTRLVLEHGGAPGEGIAASVLGEAAAQAYWYRGAWFDGINMFWDAFNSGSPLTERSFEPSEAIGEEHGTLMVRVSCMPGASASARFVIAWYYPKFKKYWSTHGEPSLHTAGAAWMNWYATRYLSASDVAKKASRSFDALLEKTRAFRDAMYGSTLPDAVIDAVSANLAVLKTPTAVRLTDGSFYAWEGLSWADGCCEGSCSHVWNYQYALPLLFPRLERSMRELDYKYYLKAEGSMPFRLQLPIGSEPHPFRACCDGQFGGVIKTWREWKLSGDTQWMLRLWPLVKRSLEFAWSELNVDKWDPERSGVLTGRQHHTLDMELFGPNSFLTGFYLCALKAGAEMACAAGDAQDAALYEAMFERGKSWVDANLFNGKWFIQKLDLSDKSVLERYDDHKETIVGGSTLDTYWNSEKKEIKYQVGEGSLVDQVLGQWHASLIGLGEIFDPVKVQSALRTIYEENFKRRINDTFNPCRLFCVGEERGTVICAYPQGSYRPAINVPYAEETMHGFEYQAGIHMLMSGLFDEGVEVISAVRERYDGRKRNPWNEFECGSNYARSMASYAAIPAASGFMFDMVEGEVGFKPVRYGEDGTFRAPWSLGCGWGTVEIGPEGTRLKVLGGTLNVRKIRIPNAESVVFVAVDRRVCAFHIDETAVVFDSPICVEGELVLAAR